MKDDDALRELQLMEGMHEKGLPIANAKSHDTAFNMLKCLYDKKAKQNITAIADAGHLSVKMGGIFLNKMATWGYVVGDKEGYTLTDKGTVEVNQALSRL